MSDELLGDVHPLEKFLKEAVSKALLNGGNVLLHVFQPPGEVSRGRENVKKMGERILELKGNS